MILSMMTAAEFASEIESFLAASGLSASQFGKQAVGDPNFVGDLRRGRSPSLRTVSRVQAFMEKHRQPDVAGSAGSR